MPNEKNTFVDNKPWNQELPRRYNAVALAAALGGFVGALLGAATRICLEINNNSTESEKEGED